ncbi:MAG: hypothetical protein GY796_14200 [Chloroflexi bacterium]|nr:hypothetical protein [Chloroflexota bacterium]
MRTFKRVVAWIVVVLSVLGLAAMLAGVVGSWIVRNKVTDITVNLLTVGETAVAATSEGLNRVDDRLDVSQENITTLEDDIVSAGEKLEETSLVGTVIANNISEETAASISEAKATAVTIADTVAALDEAVNAANEIPFVNLDGFVPTLIGDAADGLTQLEEDMAEFRAGVVERREERISTSVDFFTGLTSEMSAAIGDIQTSLNEIDERMDETSTKLAAAKISLPRTFTLITLAVNVALLFMALAFVSLLLHGWTLAQNPDLTLKELTTTGK